MEDLESRGTDQARVSVIIPVYNTERYLRQCMDSVLAQSLEEIEVICVNDGSTDGSPEILKEYAGRDKRVRVIHKENQGLVAARKTGVRAAAGDYVGYVDSDDWVEPDMYERLYSRARAQGVDLVTSGYFLEGNYTTLHLDNMEEGLYRGDGLDYLRDHAIYDMESRETGLRASLCCKLFSRELIGRVQPSVPDELAMAEDKMCLLSCLLECGSVAVLKEAFYHYRMNGDSMVHSADPDYLLQVNGVYRHLRGLYGHPCFTEDMRIQAELYVTELVLKGINTMMGFRCRNLLWIDPYWTGRIPAGSRVALYGGGELGEKYRRQLETAGNLAYAGCVDAGYAKYAGGSLEVQPPEALGRLEYDYVVITIKNPGKAGQVREQLVRQGVRRDRILWFEQRELFWRYAQAEGLLGAHRDEEGEAAGDLTPP